MISEPANRRLVAFGAAVEYRAEAWNDGPLYAGVDLGTSNIVTAVVDGEGTLLTSESCLLNPNRNPQLDRAEIEKRLRVCLGAEKVLWLGKGIDGDDTDGHVDDLTRFVAPAKVVTVVEENPGDPNYEPLRENRERLDGMTDAKGRGLEVIELPMPAPVHHDGQRCPASYANFLIANAAVLVPTFRSARDEEALGILREVFTGREVIGIDCHDMVWGLGAIHCVTQQEPAPAGIDPPRSSS